jgi:glycosyltransferase involved in cell wall biosynthesis
MKNNIKKPDVSVIVPVYNVESYLRSCLESLAGQTLKSIEIIMVNDGSTDGSPEIAAEFEKKYSGFRLINQENGGLSAARNRGVLHARGTYIGFVDSDDFVDHSMYESLYKIASQGDADVVKSGVLRFRDRTLEIMDLRRTNIDEKIIDGRVNALRCFLEKEMNIVVVNAIYRASIVKSVSFPDGKKYEDHYFTPQVLNRCNRFVQTGSIHYYYRKRKGSITGKVDPEAMADKVQSLIVLNRVLKDAGLLNEFAGLYSEYFCSMATEYHNSIIYNKPFNLRRGYSSIDSLIPPEITGFILESGSLSDSKRRDMEIMFRSHFRYFLHQKIKRLLEVAGIRKDGRPAEKKKKMNKQDPEQKELQQFREYIERYG